MTGSSGQAFQKPLRQNGELFADGEADLTVEHVIPLRRNFLQQLAINAHQNPERWLAVFVDQRNEFVARAAKLANAVGPDRKQRPEARGLSQRTQLSRGHAKSS